jgi:tetratricopeptide (TPR) repeat protein
MRHSFGRTEFQASNGEQLFEIDRAEELEHGEKWLLAAEAYRALGSSLKESNASKKAAAIAFVRAAGCFENASQNRDAAHAYSEAARILLKGSLAGEFFSRAAFNYLVARQFWTAGSHYRFAADAFSAAPTDIVNIEDPVPPLPIGAYKYLVVGRCFDASSEAFLEAHDEAWASGSSWLAGMAYLKKSDNNDASTSFKKAFTLCIRFYKTLEPESLRSCLPLTSEERELAINPMELFEKTIARQSLQNYSANAGIADKGRVNKETNKTLISVFYTFHQELRAIGNTREANEYYIRRRRLEEGYSWQLGNRLQWFGYFLWRITTEYGVNIRRLILVGVGVLGLFTFTYYLFGLIEPVTSWVDYIYFSIVTLTSLGYGDIHPKGNAGKVVASSEIIVGLLMFGMLITLLSKRVAGD